MRTIAIIFKRLLVFDIRNFHTYRIRLIALGCSYSLTTGNIAHAFGWTASDIRLLYGNDFIFGSPARTTVTVKHGHGRKYGTNFFFVDISDRSDVGLEVYSYFSMNKITGRDWSLGPIKDFSLVGGLNISNLPES